MGVRDIKRSIAAFFVAFGLFVSSAFAQPSNHNLENELNFFTGFMGADPAIGVRWENKFEASGFALSFSQVIGKTSNTYPLNVRYNLALNKAGKAVPYGIFGGGMLWVVPSNSIGAETITVGQIHFGAGFKYSINPLFGASLEFSQYVTRVENQETTRKELLFFQEINLGVLFYL